MKLSIAAFLSAISIASVADAASIKDQFHYMRDGLLKGPSMWIFNNEGLQIYSPDGKTKFKDTPPESICHNVTGFRGAGPSLSCSFYDVVSDGKKYVWGAVSRGVPKIDVFDIDTGDTVGSFETCETPRDIEYHPLRDEIWVRCMGTTSDEGVHDESQTYIDVFSATSPGVDTTSNVLLTSNSTFSAYGYSVIDNTLGDVGYATVWNQNTLYKIDLSAKTVLDTFEMSNAYGLYEVAYSPMNHHIFVRATVCCTCGFVGADIEECGRYGSSQVSITTGNFAGQVADGTCGRCDGVAGVDTLGVYEFDTVTDKLVGNHLMPEGVGGDPFPSPDGKHIVLVGRNGGEKLRILKTGANGELSKIAFDLELGFTIPEGDEADATFNDFAFIQTSRSEGDKINRDMIIVAAGTENKVALVDISSGTPRVTTLVLSSNPENSARKSKRQVEWVRGTPYVWIDGTEESEVYVVNVDTKRVVKTIMNQFTTKLLTVENFERKHTLALIENMIAENMLAQSDKSSSNNNDNNDNSNSNNSGSNTANTFSSVENSSSENESKVDPVGIFGTIIAVVALLVGVANMVVMNKAMQARGSKSGDNFEDDTGDKSLSSSKAPV